MVQPVPPWGGCQDQMDSLLTSGSSSTSNRRQKKSFIWEIVRYLETGSALMIDYTNLLSPTFQCWVGPGDEARLHNKGLPYSGGPGGPPFKHVTSPLPHFSPSSRERERKERKILVEALNTDRCKHDCNHWYVHSHIELVLYHHGRLSSEPLILSRHWLFYTIWTAVDVFTTCWRLLVSLTLVSSRDVWILRRQPWWDTLLEGLQPSRLSMKTTVSCEKSSMRNASFHRVLPIFTRVWKWGVAWVCTIIKPESPKMSAQSK